jgi:hypothetical protein
MTDHSSISRRQFVAGSLAAAAASTVTQHRANAEEVAVADSAAGQPPASTPEQADATFNGMPCGFIGKAKVSRLMLGGNLIGGYMHSRDLKYVNQLFRAYATEEKILDTLRVAEENGINTVFESGAEFVQKYNDQFQGQMQVIPHIAVGRSPQEVEDEVKRNIDCGAIAHYSWGAETDILVRDGKLDHLKRSLEIAKKYDLPVGVGSHSLTVPMLCEQHQLPCDFYVKTLHTDDYFSATPRELQTDFMWMGAMEKGCWYDNMWCIDVDKTIEFFAKLEKPWVAFKVLAAGAIPPRDGLTFAFENGADFVPLGMFDFQIAEDADLAKRIIRRAQKRDRPWRA